MKFSILIFAFVLVGCGHQTATTTATANTEPKPEAVSDEKKFAQWFMDTMKTEGHYDDCQKSLQATPPNVSPSCIALIQAVLVQRQRIDNADTCKAAYVATIDKPVNQMTNRETEQVTNCKELLMYPAPKSKNDEGYRQWFSQSMAR